LEGFLKMKQIAIGSIAKFINGYAFKPTDWTEAGNPIIRIQNLTDASKPYNRTGLAVPEKYIVRKGDTLVSWSATIDVFEWNKDEDAYLNQHIFKVEFDHDKVEKEYFKQALRYTIDDLTKFSHGSTMKHVVKGDFERHPIPLPDLQTQRQIAHLLSRAEELIAARQRSLALLDDFLKSTFLELFGDPVRNEKGWEVSTVGQYTDCIVPGRDKPKSFTGNTPWVTTEDLQLLGYTTKSRNNTGLTSEEIKEVKGKVIPEGSVLLSCVGDLGIVSIAKTDLVINQQLHSYQCHLALNNVFLMYSLSLQKGFMYRMASTTTVAYMNKAICNSIPICLPPLPLQTHFAEIVNHVETLKTRQKESLAALQNLYQSLLQRAFSGQLDVSGVRLPGQEPPSLIRRPTSRTLSTRKTKLRSAARYWAEDTVTETDLPPTVAPSQTPPQMKLLSLTLHESFRSLPAGFHIPFMPTDTPVEELTFAPYCLVGRNGSGKSNVLEALAAIFYHIDCIYLTSKPDGFERTEEQPDRGFDATQCQPDAFALSYLIRAPYFATAQDANPLWHIQIRKERGSRPVVTGYSRETDTPTNARELTRVEVPKILPDLVVGYSSGENEVLSLPFFKMRFLHFDEYLTRLSEQTGYIKPEGRLVYLSQLLGTTGGGYAACL
jgi:type I restriction enzyme, S subunit